MLNLFLQRKLLINCGHNTSEHFTGFMDWIGMLGIYPSKAPEVLGQYRHLHTDHTPCTEPVKEQGGLGEKLKKTNAHLHASQRIAKIGSWQVEFSVKTGNDKHAHFWTDETFRIFGYEPGEVEITDVLFISHVHPMDKTLVETTLQKAIREKSIYQIEHRIITKQGAVRTVFVRAEIDFDPASGNPTAMIGTVQDISEQKMMEAERQMMVDELVKQNQHLEQFAYIVSHNLRAPVANIIGFTDLAGESGISENTRSQILSGLSMAAKKADDIISDLDHVLQLKHGFNAKREEVRFSEIFQEAKFELKGCIQRECAVLLPDFSDVGSSVTVRETMKSIFLNIISNSIKYRKPDTLPVVRIKSTERDGKLVLSFKDNGIGMDICEDGTQPFQLNGRFQNDIEGKGMGLFMLRKQVETLGGTIQIKSKVNNGTEFILEFDL